MKIQTLTIVVVLVLGLGLGLTIPAFGSEVTGNLSTVFGNNLEGTVIFPTPTPTPAPASGGGGGGFIPVTPTPTPSVIPLKAAAQKIDVNHDNKAVIAPTATLALTGAVITPTPTPAPSPEASVAAEILSAQPSVQQATTLAAIGRVLNLGTGNWFVGLIAILAIAYGAYRLIRQKLKK